MTQRDILGTGWKFPIRIDARGGFSYSSGEQLVQESIWIILGTALGERKMLPRFGCGIHEQVFAPNNATTRGNVAHLVRTALTNHEPRIEVQEVAVESAGDLDNQLLIRINYRIRSTNSFQNLVYPFYIKGDEGS